MKEKFIATLLASAIGDALGMPLEFMSRSEIIKKFGGPVREFLDSPKRGLSAGQFTDDTQMMLSIAESIVEKKNVDPEDISKKFIKWIDSGDVRGAGRACRESIERLKKGIPWDKSGKSGEFAAGNGAAMRIAPVALFDYKDYEKLKKDVFVTSIITHNNRDAVAGATAIAYGIAKNLKSEKIDTENYLFEIADFVEEISEKMAYKLREVHTLVYDETPFDVALLEIGTSGYVIDSVAASFYIFLKFLDNTERVISEAASSGGDNDTIACMAGGLIGALSGLKSIPDRWAKKVEKSDYISTLASKIFELT